MQDHQNIGKPSTLSPEDPYWSQAIWWSESVKPSALPVKLIISYIATCYQAWIEETTALIPLRIGHYCMPLAALLQASGSRSAVYITACNPASRMVSFAENQSATGRLYQQLIRYSSHIYRGESIDPSGEWPAEASFLALGIDPATAKAAGHEFGQNAIVQTAADAIPRLILLR